MQLLREDFFIFSSDHFLVKIWFRDNQVKQKHSYDKRIMCKLLSKLILNIGENILYQKGYMDACKTLKTNIKQLNQFQYPLHVCWEEILGNGWREITHTITIITAKYNVFIAQLHSKPNRVEKLQFQTQRKILNIISQKLEQQHHQFVDEFQRKKQAITTLNLPNLLKFTLKLKCRKINTFSIYIKDQNGRELSSCNAKYYQSQKTFIQKNIL